MQGKGWDGMSAKADGPTYFTHGQTPYLSLIE